MVDRDRRNTMFSPQFSNGVFDIPGVSNSINGKLESVFFERLGTKSLFCILEPARVCDQVGTSTTQYQVFVPFRLPVFEVG